jgi:mannosyltransferase OCH1-like enzyme
MSRTIHRLWMGPPMPEDYERFGRSWGDLNPGWTVKDWTKEEVESLDLTNRAIWDHIDTHGAISAINHHPLVGKATQLADVAGYELIHRFGGVYVNCDMEPLKPLSRLPVRDDEAWACIESAHWVNNGAMGGPAGHPFWQLVIDELPRRFKELPDQAMHITTGPHLLTKIAYQQKEAGVGPQLHILEKNWFNPVLYSQVGIGQDAAAYRRDAIRSGSIAIHHWGHKRHLGTRE